MYRLAIFDFDGTLADSLGAFLRGYNGCADRFGLRPIENRELESLRGMGAADLAKHFGVPLWKIPLIASAVRKSMSRELHTIHLFDGVPDAITRLAARGITIAIVTSNSEHNVRTVLGDRLASAVSFYECGASIFGKAARFRKLLRHTATPGAAAISIGDEIRDAHAATKAGVDFGAVTWGYTNRDALLQQSPRMVFDDVPDLLRIA